MSWSTASAEAGRRRLIAVEISTYPDTRPDEREAFAKGIKAQVALIEDWVADSADSFDVVHVSVPAHQPAEVLEEVRNNKLRGFEPDDAILLYVTGHGERGLQSRQHRLLLPDATVYHTADLVMAAMKSGAGHVVVLVDSCYAGTLGTELLGLLGDEQQALSALPASCCIVLSGHPDDTPRLREFATVVTRALRLLRTDKFAPPAESRYLSPQVFLDALREVGRAPEVVPPQLAWPNGLDVSKDPCLALPNPVFDRYEIVTMRQSQGLALTRAEVWHYWIEKASGRPDSAEAGWFFKGREELMAELVSFMRVTVRPSPPPGVLVVAGEAGSGKSAMIARAVTLADPDFCHDPEFKELIAQIPDRLRPPVGCVDVAVTARGLTAERLALSLLVALPAAAALEPLTAAGHSLPTRLLRACGPAAAAQGRPLSVVIDGVDEAVDPASLITEIIKPLVTARDSAGVPVARVLLGVRSSAGGDVGLPNLVERAVFPVPILHLRSDGPGTQADVEAYLKALLLSLTESPYWGDSVAASQAAAVVAGAVAPRFLDARVVGSGLRAATTRQDLWDGRWLSSLSDATVTQFGVDLVDVAHDLNRPWEQLLAILRATAVAGGAGVPWGRVWPAMVKAVLGRALPEPDEVIAAVLDSRLGGYLTTATEDGHRVFRPNHERLTEVLRDEPRRLLQPRELL